MNANNINVMDNSNVERNKAMMRRFEQFINTQDEALGREVISEDSTFYAPTSPEPMHGLESYIGVVNMMHGAMPDIKWVIKEMIAEGSKVCCRYEMTGTQTQPFMGMPATGKPINVTALNIYTFNDEGKIIEEYGMPDLFSMLGQLGFLPAKG